MWLLGRILPILIGRYVPDDDDMWRNFCLMMEIVDILFSTKLTKDDAEYLKCLIKDHHEDFCQIYPNASVIPKMHFMIHLSRLSVE